MRVLVLTEKESILLAEMVCAWTRARSWAKRMEILTSLRDKVDAVEHFLDEEELEAMN